MALNVLGGELQTCSLDPLTGYRRDGCCDTAAGDTGVHTVCAVMSDEFLAFAKEMGNDLSTPRPERATAGACAHRAGRRPSRPDGRLRWSSRPPMSSPSSGATARR
jgi:uncharacterized protein (DUF2237 family)